MFLKYLQLDGYDIKERSNYLYELIQSESSGWLQSHLIDFIYFQKQRVANNEISETTIDNYIKAVKTFCDMNNVLLNWKYIRKGVPKGRKSAVDRIPESSEIKQLLRASDIRLKPIVYVMLSSGIRVSVWEELRWKHVIPIYDSDNNTTLLGARLQVYPGDEEEYYTFITPEAYISLKEWMDFRASHGEKIEPDSWVMRDIWQITDLPTHGGQIRLASHPQKLTVGAIKNIIYRALRSQNVIKKLDKLQGEGRRHEFKTMHGFRKAFKTICEKSGMKSINIELLLGHDIGVSRSYYKPSEKEVFEDYVKHAVDYLTVNEENRLNKKVIELQQKTQDQNYIIAAKLQEKDDQIKTLTESIKFLSDKVNAFFISQPQNKIVSDLQSGIVKGIQVEPEINNTITGTVISSDNTKKRKLT